MTDNQQRAAELLPSGLMALGAIYRDDIAAALDAAEARGWAEAVAQIETLAVKAVRIAGKLDTHVTVSALRLALGARPAANGDDLA